MSEGYEGTAVHVLESIFVIEKFLVREKWVEVHYLFT